MYDCVLDVVAYQPVDRIARADGVQFHVPLVIRDVGSILVGESFLDREFFLRDHAVRFSFQFGLLVEHWSAHRKRYVLCHRTMC